MIFDLSTLVSKYSLKINGVLHIGAHLAEEIYIYQKVGIPEDKIIWVEANNSLVNQIKKQHPTWRVINEVIYSEDNEDIVFNISNCTQCSSIFDFDFHLTFNPGLRMVETVKVKSKTIKTMYEEQKIDPNFANFVSMDIQGGELHALKGMKELIKNFDYLYLEVNTAHLYKDGALMNEIDEYVATFNFERIETSICENQWGDALYIKRTNPTV